MQKLAILGASGHGKVVADTAELLGYHCVFFDDAWPTLSHNGPWLITGDTSILLQQLQNYHGVVVAIGNNDVRAEKIALLQSLKVNLPTLIHPRATVSKYAQIECGTVIFANAVVNVAAKIGVGCILNTACSVDHDCRLDSGVHISPGAHIAGGVIIQKNTWIGVGASIKQYITIGNNVTVGAGATVLNNVPANATVVGTPARPLSRDK